MAVITSAVVGIGTAAYGAYSSSKNTKKANQQNAIAASNQLEVQRQSQLASEASIRAEALRERQMELEGIRRRRDIYRAAQASTALGTATAIAQGVSTTSSSVQAGRQSAATQERIDILANLQNIMIGAGIFEENRNITAANAAGANFQTQANLATSASGTYQNRAAQGQNLMSFGLNLATSGPTIDRVAQTTRQNVTGLFGNRTIL